MSTHTPMQYALRIMEILDALDGNTRTSLSIASALVEHQIICEGIKALGVVQQVVEEPLCLSPCELAPEPSCQNT
jgi:hypothetical protein